MSTERDFTIVSVTDIDELSDSWKTEVIADTDFISGTFADFGMAEECLGLLEFEDVNGKTIYEVGVGESLRPYDQLYIGNSCEIASKTFIDEINRLKQ